MTNETSVTRPPRRSFQQELAPSQRRERVASRENNGNNSGQDEDAASFRSSFARRGRGRSESSYRGRRKRGEQDPSSTPAEADPSQPAPPPVSTQPVGPATPIAPTSESQSLAQRYVAQYESQSGTTLSDEDRALKVQQIADFYNTPVRSARLEKIVFA